MKCCRQPRDRGGCHGYLMCESAGPSGNSVITTNSTMSAVCVCVQREREKEQKTEWKRDRGLMCVHNKQNFKRGQQTQLINITNTSQWDVCRPSYFKRERDKAMYSRFIHVCIMTSVCCLQYITGCWRGPEPSNSLRVNLEKYAVFHITSNSDMLSDRSEWNCHESKSLYASFSVALSF